MDYERKRIQDWIMSLEPGDIVIGMNVAGKRIRVFKVKRITPTGIVRTEPKGSFRQRNTGEPGVYACGNPWFRIVPCTPELLAEAKRQDQELGGFTGVYRENVKKEETEE